MESASLNSKREPEQLRAIDKLLKAKYAPGEFIDVLSPQEIADVLKVDVRTIYRKIKKIERIKHADPPEPEDSDR